MSQGRARCLLNDAAQHHARPTGLFIAFILASVHRDFIDATIPLSEYYHFVIAREAHSYF